MREHTSQIVIAKGKTSGKCGDSANFETIVVHRARVTGVMALGVWNQYGRGGTMIKAVNTACTLFIQMRAKPVHQRPPILRMSITVTVLLP